MNLENVLAMMDKFGILYVILQLGLMLSTFCFASTIVAVCEQQSETITCPEGINVISARYGRFDTTTCIHAAMYQVGCGADGVFDDIQDLCGGEISCELAPSNGNYGDPCPNTFKYLEVNYSCLPEQTTTQLVTTTEFATTSTSTTTTTTETTTTLPPTTTTPIATTERLTTTETTTDQQTTSSSTTDQQTTSSSTTGHEMTSSSTTDYQTTSLSTTTATFLKTNASCTCICRYLNDTTCEGGDLLCTLAKLRQELSINKSTLSSFKRTKISAYDGRTSSKVIGISGVAVIMIVIVLVVTPDVIKVVSFVFCSKFR